MPGHSRLPPSGASAWTRCPGWVGMQQAYPEMGSDAEAAAEGTAAHWAAAEGLLGRMAAPGVVDPAGTVVDEEMLEAVGLYLADVWQVCAEAGVTPVVEQPVAIPRVHPECWGTPDAWAYDAKRGILYVWDFKYGHRFVEVVDNLQLIAYAAGLLDSLGINGQQDQHVRLSLRIVQPRAYTRDGPVRHWEILASDIRGPVNLLAAAAVEALSDSPTYRAGDQCQYCAGRHTCRALQHAAAGAADTATRELPVQMPPGAVGHELRLLRRALALLESRCSGLELEALRMLGKGERVPYWAAQQSSGRARWAKPVEEVLALGQMFGVDLAKPAEPITPKQAAALIDESVINAYSEKPKGAMKLVPLNETSVKKVFQQ